MKKIFLIFLIVIYIIGITNIPFQNDIFFDIKVGENILEGNMYEYDNFSIHENLEYTSHHFIPSILIYKIYNLFGFTGLYVFKLLLALIVAILFYLVNKMMTKNKMFAYIFTYFEMFMFSTFISIRAQMFSSIIFLILILLLEKYRQKENKKLLILITCIPILIMNFHSGVIIYYYILLAIYMLSTFKIFKGLEVTKKHIRKLIYPVIISLPLLLINAYGINGIMYFFKTLSNEVINGNISEFMPLHLQNGFFYIILILLINLMFILTKKEKYHLNMGIIYFGILTSFVAVRHIIFLIYSMVFMLIYFEDFYDVFIRYMYTGIEQTKKMNKLLFTVSSIVVLVYSLNILLNKDYSYIDKEMIATGGVEYIKNNIGSDKRIFNEYVWGSYMMLNNIKVFIDSRCDLYTNEYNKGVEVAKDYMDAVKGKISYYKLTQKYNLEYFFLEKENIICNYLLEDENANLIYEDNMSYIFKYN